MTTTTTIVNSDMFMSGWISTVTCKKKNFGVDIIIFPLDIVIIFF